MKLQALKTSIDLQAGYFTIRVNGGKILQAALIMEDDGTYAEELTVCESGVATTERRANQWALDKMSTEKVEKFVFNQARKAGVLVW